MGNPYATFDHYGLRHFPAHLVDIEKWDTLEKILTDLYFVEAKCAAGMTYDLLRDYALVRERLPEAQEESKQKRTQDEILARYARTLLTRSLLRRKADAVRFIVSVPLKLDQLRQFRRHNGEDMCETSGEGSQRLIEHPPVSALPLTEEMIEQKNEQVIERPTRLDHIQEFAHFVGAEAHNFVRYAPTHPQLCIQQAFNSADRGPVAAAARQRLIKPYVGGILLKNHTALPKFRARPACVRTFIGHTGYIGAVALSADGIRAVSASGDHTVRVWDVSSGECLKVLRGHSSSIRSIALSADGKIAVSGDSQGTLRIWNVQTERYFELLKAHDGWISAIAITPDARVIVSTGYDDTVRVWDVLSGECLKVLEGHSSLIDSIALSADGKVAVSASRDKTARVWDVLSGECLKVLEGHSDMLVATGLSADGKVAVSASADSVRVWDVEAGKCLRVLERINSALTFALSVDARVAVSGDRDGNVKIWDVEAGECVKLPDRPDSIGEVALSADGKMAVWKDGDTLKAWDLQMGEHAQVLRRPDFVRSGKLSTDGEVAVIFADFTLNKTLSVWNIKTGDCLELCVKQEPQMGGLGEAIAFSSNGKVVVSSAYKHLIVWDVASGKSKCRLEGHSRNVHAAALSADGKLAVSGGDDGTVRVWDVDNAKCTRVLKAHADSIRSIALSADGRVAIWRHRDKLLCWDVEANECAQILQEAGLGPYYVSANGRVAVSGQTDMRVWDIATAKSVLFKHVRTVALSADGRVAISRDDGTVCVLDAKRSVVSALIPDLDTEKIAFEQDIVACVLQGRIVCFLFMQNPRKRIEC
ncbi:MAG: WD40 repeat domain-containing protein [Halobacteriota archaeon]